jgi:hypothetical protein
MLDQMTEVSDEDQTLVQARVERLERIIQTLLLAPLRRKWKAIVPMATRDADCLKRPAITVAPTPNPTLPCRAEDPCAVSGK